MTVKRGDRVWHLGVPAVVRQVWAWPIRYAEIEDEWWRWTAPLTELEARR